MLLLCKGATYIYAIRLSYCCIEELPISVQLGYPIILEETAYFYAIGYSTVV